MAVNRFSILSVFIRMRMNNYFTVINVCVIEKCVTAEKPQEEKKKKISGYFFCSTLQLVSHWIIISIKFIYLIYK